ncbi:MAG: ankyrin repeat domain-containing protein [Thermodesulfobacteriota bacterium]
MGTRLNRRVMWTVASLAAWLMFTAAQAGAADDCCGRLRTCAERRSPMDDYDSDCDNTESGRPAYQRTDNALLLAARYGRVGLVKQLLSEGAPVDTKGGLDQTALMEAAQNGHVAVVRLLVRRGADINAKDDISQTALMLAAGKGHVRVVTALLKRGADVNARSGFGTTALMEAIRECRLDVAKALVDGGADINATDKRGTSILMQEVRKGNGETVELLLRYGADCNIRDKGGDYALKIALRNGDRELASLLGRHGATSDEPPLVLASYLGIAGEVERLLRQGADVNTADKFYGRTALMWAAEQGNEKVVGLLLDKGADVNAKSPEGWTALMSAAMGGDPEVVRRLLDKGADVQAEDAFHRRSGLAWAFDDPFFDELMDLLRERGAVLSLHLAAGLGDLKAVHRLIREGADVNAKEGNGATPLMRAAATGNLEIVRLLLDTGADPNAKDEGGRTALMKVSSDHPEVALLLVVRGAQGDSARTVHERKVEAMAQEGGEGLDEYFREYHEASMKLGHDKQLHSGAFSLAFSCPKNGELERTCLSDAFEPGREVVLFPDQASCVTKTGTSFDHDHFRVIVRSTVLEKNGQCPNDYQGVAVVGKDPVKVRLIPREEAPVLVPEDVASRAWVLIETGEPLQPPWPWTGLSLSVIRSTGRSLFVFGSDDGTDGGLVLEAHGTMTRLDGWCTSRHVFFTVEDKLHLAYINSCCGCDWRYLVVYDLSEVTPKKAYVRRIPGIDPNATSNR